MLQNTDEKIKYFSVNSLAPKGEGMTVFAKKVVGPKSDGFAVVDGGRVFVIDIGKADDMECANYYTADGNLFFYIDEKGINAYGIDPWHTPE